jgi:hypothetical protein
MSNTNNNPLAKHFRQPSIYVKLPSDGAFYDETIFDPTESGEVPVYPMTAMDEITYRTADALFNGSAVANVIKSCVPSFKDPWQVSTLDIDTLLVAIRIASYGHEMEFQSKCPQCEEINELSIDLREVMERIKTPDFTKTVSHGDLEIHFKPLTYKEQNTNVMAQFQDQKMLEALPDAEISEEEKLRLMTESYTNISHLTMEAIADSISMIKAGDDVVVDKEYLREFVLNCDNKVFAKIRERIDDIKTTGQLDPLKIVCNDCKHEYETPFTLNQSDFFE